MAGGRLGADQCVCRLSCGMVHHREGADRGFVPRKAVVSAARRGNWRCYHDHGYLEYGRARPGEGGDAGSSISQLAAAWLIELFGLFGMEKTDFTVRKLLGMAVAVVGIVVFQWDND